MERKTLTLPRLRQMARDGERITMLTCYDACFAALLDDGGVDVMLVGDSLGMVLQGHDSTLPVTLDDMVYHTASVARAKGRAWLLADAPFGSYQRDPEQAYDTAARLMSAGAQMVKLEGGAWLAGTVDYLTKRGIPICAHIGLTPQTVHHLGGFRVQGRDEDAADALIEDARALARAGAEMLVLELMPTGLGKAITEAIDIPTIGIGAGPETSGQVLVLHDMLGITPGRVPRFVRDFTAGQPSIAAAVSAFVQAVREGRFPGPEHCH